MGKSIVCVTPSSNVSSSVYYPLAGQFLAQTTETQSQVRIRTACVLSKMQVNVSVNNVTATSTWILRKNAANANQTISITSSTTGRYQDTTNTDTIAAADSLNYSFTHGGSGTNITKTFASTVITLQIQPLLYLL